MSEVRALIVDDSTVMRKIVERALRQAGLDPLVHEVAAAHASVGAIDDEGHGEGPSDRL